MSAVRGGVTATIIGHLICRVIGHGRWHTAGLNARVCKRCHHWEPITRAGDIS